MPVGKLYETKCLGGEELFIFLSYMARSCSSSQNLLFLPGRCTFSLIEPDIIDHHRMELIIIYTSPVFFFRY